MNFFKIYLKVILILLLFNYSQFSFAENSAQRYWVGAEYLYWRVQDSPISIPLITENNTPGTFAIINEPGTKIIFGAGSNKNLFNFDGISGARLSLGAWIDADSQYGVEASAFDLPKVKQSFSASSINSNIAVINIPFNSGNEDVLVNKNTPNTAFVRDTFQSYGFEINALHTIARDTHFPLIVYMGFRYLTIQENFLLNDMSLPAQGGLEFFLSQLI